MTSTDRTDDDHADTRERPATAQLWNDPRVRSAQQLLHESRAADGSKVEAARWWGRLEACLAGVLRAIEEVPPF